MTQEEMLTTLYEKMAAEQDKYRDWLKGQPAAEVLNHAYEYTVREDIVMCMEELELTEAQAKALLASPTPLADVYKDFEKLETGYMDVIRDTIETRANEMYQAQEKLKNTPLYPHSVAYASEHGEMAQYNASFQASHACMEAIEQAISRHYSNNRLDAEAAVNDVLEQFGPAGYSMCWPTRFGIRNGMGASPATIRRGPAQYPCRRTTPRTGTAAIWWWTAAIPA